MYGSYSFSSFLNGKYISIIHPAYYFCSNFLFLIYFLLVFTSPLFKVLEGRSYRLQHPWVGIVNRSQADINKNVDMINARRKEQEYFESSPEYGHLAHKMGSEYLAKLLSKVCQLRYFMKPINFTERRNILIIICTILLLNYFHSIWRQSFVNEYQASYH